MLQALKDYFKARGILSTHFRCEHRLSCAARAADKDRRQYWETDACFALEDTGEGDARACPRCGELMARRKAGEPCEGCGYKPYFTGPKSSYVGTEYERSVGFAQGGLPRLLILSPDSGGETWDATSKTPEQVRRGEEPADHNVAGFRKNTHWSRTYELASYILRVFDSKFEDSQNVNGHFAHVNVAKCSGNRRDNAQTDLILFKNCRGYLSGELEILRPDILITQGVQARDALRSLYRDPADQMSKIVWVPFGAGHEALRLWTYHPTSRYQYFGKERDFDKKTETARGWERYSAQIHELMERSRAR